ncbi:MAG: hypothetical protein R3A13_07195 [Bdellovibrionota bacterium]
MFWSSKEFLQICEELATLGFKPELNAGGRIARGFADLGFEEYLYLPPNKLISLFTGDKSILPEEHRDFFFVVPTVDEMVNAILEYNARVLSIEHVEQRVWSVLGLINQEPYTEIDRDLKVAMAKFLRALLSLESPNVGT